jgi:hypothetical protein
MSGLLFSYFFDGWKILMKNHGKFSITLNRKIRSFRQILCRSLWVEFLECPMNYINPNPKEKPSKFPSQSPKKPQKASSKNSRKMSPKKIQFQIKIVEKIA